MTLYTVNILLYLPCKEIAIISKPMIFMKFLVDKQTLKDLEIFESNINENSIIGLFEPISLGGKEKLSEFFNNPFTSVHDIRQRQSALKYITKNGIGFSIDKEDLDFIEHYLSKKEKPITLYEIILEKGIMEYIRPSNHYHIIKRGIHVIIRQLKEFYTIVSSSSKFQPDFLSQADQKILSILEHPDFILVQKLFNKQKLDISDIHQCDYLFRVKGHDRLKEILNIIYALDVLQAVARAAKKNKFCYPVFGNRIEIQGVFHPFLVEPVRNNIVFQNDKNLHFITGANMAGKSTFLKSVGVSIFLAHLGFPVPAIAMNTTLMKGLITTLNISDNIHLGYSHFYSEVNRVKEVALAVKNTSGMFVIFDELFRGTNVKDAYDASAMIIDALSNIKESYFIISSHIVEVALNLKENDKIDFKFLEVI